MMWRNIASNAMTLFVVILAVLSGVVAWGKSRYSAAGPLGAAICLQVGKGYTMTRVSNELAAQGAVSSATIFRMGAKYADKSQSLKAGSFLVPDGASMAQIVDIVTRGGASTCGTEVVYRIGITKTRVQVRVLDPATNQYVERIAFDLTEGEMPSEYSETRSEPDVRYRLTLAEGVTSWQIVEALKGADFLTGEVAELPPEGMQAPDSYEVSEGDTRASVLAKMQAAQEVLLDAAWEARAEGLPLASKEEALVLASIIEKETGIAAERGQVASVFVNRLERGIRLQTDPTVIYGITKGQGTLGRGLRRSELRRETPYNTYLIDGLPPGPIANPGKAAIEAALNPDSTSYIFFVADGTGGHAFAETLAEHNKNVARWREIEAERNDN